MCNEVYIDSSDRCNVIMFYNLPCVCFVLWKMWWFNSSINYREALVSYILALLLIISNTWSTAESITAIIRQFCLLVELLSGAGRINREALPTCGICWKKCTEWENCTELRIGGDSYFSSSGLFYIPLISDELDV